MNDELIKKMNHLMYYLTKMAARSSFADFLEDLDITEDEYKEIKAQWAKIGINKTYL